MDSKPKQISKLLAKAISQYGEANRGVDDEKVHQRALQMHGFVAQWTYPRDVVCMAVLSQKKEITKAIFDAAAENSEEMGELMDQMVSIVLHLYSLAEARMEVELERLGKEQEEASRLDPERKLRDAEEKEGG